MGIRTRTLYVAAVGWLAKFLTAFISVYLIKIFSEIDSSNGVAAYAMLINITGWSFIFNFGVSYYLQNLISKETVDGCGRKVSSMYLCMLNKYLFFIFVVIAFPLGLWIEFSLKKYSSINLFFQYAIAITILSGAALEINLRALLAQGRGDVANMLPLFQSGLTLLLLVIAKYNLIINLELYLLLAVLPILITWLYSCYLIKMPSVFDFDFCEIYSVWQIIYKSRRFLTFNLLCMIVMKIDFFILSRFESAEVLAEYLLLQKIVELFLFLYQNYLNAAWPKISEMIFINKKIKATKIIKSAIILGICGLVSMVILSLLFIDDIFNIVAGRSYSLSASLGVIILLYLFLRVIIDPFTTALLASNKANIVNIYLPFQAMLTLVAMPLLVEKYGITGVYIAHIVTLLLTAAWVNPLYYKKML